MLATTRLRLSLRMGFAVFALGIVGWLVTYAVTGRVERWPKIADDAYYYFGVAENLSRGYGFTMDRINPTNGFHPLWMAVLVGVHWLAPGPTMALVLVQLLQILLCAAALGMLSFLLLRHVRPSAALLPLIMIAYPRYFNQLTAGVEGSLVFLILSALVLNLSSANALDPRPRFASAWTGLLVGVLLLARLDAVFVALAIAGRIACASLGEPASLWRRLQRTSIRCVATFWPTLLLVVPYLLANHVLFGHVVPVSGILKSSFPDFAWNLGLLTYSKEQVVLTLLGVGGASGMVRAIPTSVIRILRMLAVGSLVHLFYMVAFMEWAVWPWYFVTHYVGGLITIAFLAERVLTRLSAPRRRLLLGSCVCAMSALMSISLSRVRRNWYEEPNLEASDWINRNLPEDAILAMKDSGALTYFSRRRVINLDGLANSIEYQMALCRGNLDTVLRQQGAGYVVDHEDASAVAPGHESHSIDFPCHLRGGVHSRLTFQEQDLVFLGTPYVEQGVLRRVAVWRR